MTFWIEADAVLWENRAIGTAILQSILGRTHDEFPRGMPLKTACELCLQDASRTEDDDVSPLTVTPPVSSSMLVDVPSDDLCGADLNCDITPIIIDDSKISSSMKAEIDDEMPVLKSVLMPCIGAMETLLILIDRFERLSTEERKTYAVSIVVDDILEANAIVSDLLHRLPEDAPQRGILNLFFSNPNRFVTYDHCFSSATENDFVACITSSDLSDAMRYSQSHPRMVVGSSSFGNTPATFNGLDDLTGYITGRSHAQITHAPDCKETRPPAPMVEAMPDCLKTSVSGALYRVEPLKHISSNLPLTKAMWQRQAKVERRHIIGTVVKGFQRGSKELGIPTANIEPICGVSGYEDSPPVRCPGVYIGTARFMSYDEANKAYVPKGYSNVDKDRMTSAGFPFIMSVGYNPFYGNTRLTIEPHLLHSFEADFYDEILELEIDSITRVMSNFTRFDQLVCAIQLDCEHARALSQIE